jgi:hypothetical protein
MPGWHLARLSNRRDQPAEEGTEAEAERGHGGDRRSRVGRATRCTEPRDLIAAGERFDLLLVTPGKDDLAHLRADYSDDSTLARCLPLFQLIEDSAAAIVTARTSDLPVIANVLLPLCGFRRLSRVLLTQRPTSPDVTDAEIIITAQRGDMRLRPSEDGGWLDHVGSIDPLAIAARLFPATSRRLHVFASAKADGWRCLVGDDSWAEQPSLR